MTADLRAVLQTVPYILYPGQGSRKLNIIRV